MKLATTTGDLWGYTGSQEKSMEYISQAEAMGRFDLERLPDDASETVRIVKVGDYDECLCIGLHVDNTSEIGTFKIISHDYDAEAQRWRMRFKLI